MRTLSLTSTAPIGLLCLLLTTAPLPTVAQSPPVLHLDLYAGVTITGVVGTVYSIETTLDLADPHPDAWQCLEFLQLPTSPYLWIDRSATAIGRRYYRAAEFPQPANLVFIPPGTFRMGSPTTEADRWAQEGPQTEVILPRGFWIGRYEVTQAEYETVTGTNPSAFPGDPNRPVETVNWFEATDYCERLTQRERGLGRIPANTQYRLPSEAEWEYACRAWTSTRFSYGEDPDYANLSDYAWYFDNRRSSTQPVGQKLPNPWGIHDLHGNVWEWCQDWLAPYPGGVVIDPQGPLSGVERVFRGGGWSFAAFYARSAHRWGFSPDVRGNGLGLRVVLAPNPP
jgi:formylglycine-generating enzyme required for sulfatase activity